MLERAPLATSHRAGWGAGAVVVAVGGMSIAAASAQAHLFLRSPHHPRPAAKESAL